MELHDVMRTTFACRQWTDEPVRDATLYRVLDNARFAPNGGNRQGHRVIVLRDRTLRQQLVPLAKAATDLYLAQQEAGEAPWNSVVPTRVDENEIGARAAQDQDQTRVSFAGVKEMVGAPVVLVVTIDLSVVASFDKNLERIGVISGASIYPFVWNILLAARNEGLGGVLTTYLAAQEPAVQKLLGVPEHHAIAAMVPLGVPVKQLTKLSRRDVETFATIDNFTGEPFSG